MPNEYRVRALKQRRGQKDKDAANFVITVPAHIGRRIVGQVFTFQLTDSGILYSLKGEEEVAESAPQWLSHLETHDEEGIDA